MCPVKKLARLQAQFVGLLHKRNFKLGESLDIDHIRVSLLELEQDSGKVFRVWWGNLFGHHFEPQFTGLLNSTSQGSRRVQGILGHKGNTFHFTFSLEQL